MSLLELSINISGEPHTAGWKAPTIELKDMNIDGDFLSGRYVKYVLEVTAGYETQSLQVHLWFTALDSRYVPASILNFNSIQSFTLIIILKYEIPGFSNQLKL